MLSAAAWNAFLKTLEEPPPHVVFVLATTEAHKVPATIIDRCHRFDFRRPSLEQIAGVLDRVAGEEGIALPDPAVGHARARGHRQLPRRPRHARAARHLRRQRGEARRRARHPRRGRRRARARGRRRADRARRHRPPAGWWAGCPHSGRDFTQFMRDLSAHLRHLFVVQTLGDVPDSFAVTAEHADRLAAQAERATQAELLRADRPAGRGDAPPSRTVSEPRMQLEIALLKAAQPQADASLKALMSRIEQLEARARPSAPPPAAGRAPPAAEPPRSAAGSAGPRPEASAPPVRRARRLGRSRPGPGRGAAPWRWPSPPTGRSSSSSVLDALARRGRGGAPRTTACSARSLGAARPVSLEGERLTVALPARRRLREEEGRGQPRHRAAGDPRADRAVAVGVAFELRDTGPAAEPVTLGEASSSSASRPSSAPKRSSRTRPARS